MDNIKIRFYSTKLGKDLGDVFVKNLKDAIILNNEDKDELSRIRLEAIEAVAVCERFLFKLSVGGK